MSMREGSAPGARFGSVCARSTRPSSWQLPPSQETRVVFVSKGVKPTASSLLEKTTTHLEPNFSREQVAGDRSFALGPSLVSLPRRESAVHRIAQLCDTQGLGHGGRTRPILAQGSAAPPVDHRVQLLRQAVVDEAKVPDLLT